MRRHVSAPRPLRDLNALPAPRLLADSRSSATSRSKASGRSTTSRRRAAGSAARSAPIPRCTRAAGPGSRRSASPTRSTTCIASTAMDELAFQDETFFTHPPRVDALADEFLQRATSTIDVDGDAARRSGVPAGRGAVREGGARGTAPRDGRRRVGLAGDARPASRRTCSSIRCCATADDVRAPRRRRHLQLHRRVPGRVGRRASRPRWRSPSSCAA